ncbi:hypothetical protein E2562_020646 [Oryza meyeriana var. granulata]|uniref:Cysteine-rich PDZ-binding protein n=1 Tax=Oryza meyeriana var. granulata TaxID=110450 RepID=A0A6G1EB45_9ORYZ|nr:hypothetical protein E2562_020646 [Oryza meyeriana var. granulata]
MVCAKREEAGEGDRAEQWKEGASNTFESGGRKIKEKKLLSKKNRTGGVQKSHEFWCLHLIRWTPYGNTKWIICKQQVHQDAKYCHTCAYSKGGLCNVRQASDGHEAV